MELLTIHHMGEAEPRNIIAACDDTDTCPSCGAGYRVGLSECEYCRQAVKCVADGSWSPSIYGDGSGQALPCIKGDGYIVEGWGIGARDGYGYAIGVGSSN